MTDVDWNFQLAQQLDWHWREQLRPRLNGLTDEEYFWEPVPGCWNVRPRGTSDAPVLGGSGAFTIDFAPHPQTGIPGGQMHSPSSRRNASFTMRSSRE